MEGKGREGEGKRRGGEGERPPPNNLAQNRPCPSARKFASKITDLLIATLPNNQLF